MVGQLEKLLESDLVLARVVARAVEEELLSIKRTLMYKARRDDIREALSQGDRNKLTLLLKEDYEKTFPRKLGRWVVTDQRGKLLACYPVDKSIYDANFAWRDWFNGTGDHPDQKEGQFGPLRQTKLSQPFVGQSQGHPLCIAASTPIWRDKEDGAVAGVLMATVLLDEIHRWLDERAGMDHGFVALINDNGQYLRHRDWEAIKPKQGEISRQFDSPVIREVLAGKEGSSSHEDPLDGTTYFTAYAPLPRIGWGTLIQHDRDAALQPINTLKESLQRFFWIGLVAGALLLSLLWGALIVTLRHSARTPRG